MVQSVSHKENNFVTEEICRDLAEGKFNHVHTRFAPEPNAYIHIGSAFSMSITYNIAEQYNGKYNLRFDDTNPSREKTEYVESIKEDIRWLGYDWEDREFYASDYFNKLYDWAIELIMKGKAYVCDLSEEEIKTYRGTNVFGKDGKRETPPGKNSPYRNRSIEENLDLFEHICKGEFPDGAKTLRAKIDMSHHNLIMRDPVMYRIIHTDHHRTGNKWCIYPTYDWAHGQSDSIEGITHSICAMEFKHHRPLYDWFIDQLAIHHPRQIEYPRINLTHTVMSKRLLLPLVEQGYVSGWDDPRLPTIRGLRRRGYPPEVIRDFCKHICIAENKTESMIDIRFFEHFVRKYLNKIAPRVMAVLNPLKVIITNYPCIKEEEFTAINNPEDGSAGTRTVPFSRELYIEQDDFMETPPPKFYRLAPGREVRLRYAYFITCEKVVKDSNGKIKELHCTYDSETRGGDAPDGRKVKSTLHWVSSKHAVKAEIRLYDYLFNKENPLEVKKGENWLDNVNPKSFIVLKECYVEPRLATMNPGYLCQFERQGYFCIDSDSSSDFLVFNRVVSLKDTWKKLPGNSLTFL